MKGLTEENYKRMTGVSGRTPEFAMFVRTVDRLVTAVIFLSYPLLLAYMYFFARGLFLKSIIVPAVSFVGVTLFRKIFNAKRPYEVMDFEPIIHKDTKGKSFPSRHVFSIFMIGMTFMQLDIIMGCIICMLGVILAAIRVLGGVHFIRDVVAGAVVGLFCGTVGYYIITFPDLF